MIVFATPAGLRASYFDNEGHAINYAMTATADGVEMLSDDVPNQPRFKLTIPRTEPTSSPSTSRSRCRASPELKHYTGATVHRK